MTAGVAEVDDPSLAATLEKFRLYETRAVSTSPPASSFPVPIPIPVRSESLIRTVFACWAARRGST